jgi:hypothetical protein
MNTAETACFKYYCHTFDALNDMQYYMFAGHPNGTVAKKKKKKVKKL